MRRPLVAGVVEWKRMANDALSIRAYGRSQSGALKALAEAADRALDKAGKAELELYRYEFVDGMSWQMASDKMHLCKSAYYMVRCRLLERVADEILGG